MQKMTAQAMQKMTAQAKMKLAREELMIDHHFFGQFLYEAKFICATEARGETIDTMATDGRNIWYNPDFVDSLALGEVKGVQCHEAMHIADAHHLRRDDRDMMEWNIACDLAINPLILKSKLILPPGGLIDPQYEGMTAEEIYHRRQQKAAQGGKDGAATQQPGKVGKLLQPLQDDGKPLSEDQLEAAKHDVRVRVLQAARIAEMAGTLPAGIERMVEEAKDPPKKWTDILRRFIVQSIQTPQYTTWNRQNRRAMAMNMIMPGWHREDPGDLVIIKDTSGSIDDIANAQFDAEIKRIVEDVRPKRVTTMAVDTKVYGCKTFEEGEEITISSRGGGGTSFRPGFAKITELGLTPKAVVYFTDMQCSTFPSDPGVPVMWVKWGGSKGVTPPFGEVVDLNSL